ncbi:MAG: hypothetical protein ABIH00_06115 [Armatimonadota bacterium]
MLINTNLGTFTDPLISIGSNKKKVIHKPIYKEKIGRASVVKYETSSKGQVKIYKYIIKPGSSLIQRKIQLNIATDKTNIKIFVHTYKTPEISVSERSPIYCYSCTLKKSNGKYIVTQKPYYTHTGNLLDNNQKSDMSKLLNLILLSKKDKNKTHKTILHIIKKAVDTL